MKNGYPGSVVDTIMAGLLKPDAGKASSETGEAKQHVVIRLPWIGPVSNGFSKEIRDTITRACPSVVSSKSGFHCKASVKWSEQRRSANDFSEPRCL